MPFDYNGHIWSHPDLLTPENMELIAQAPWSPVRKETGSVSYKERIIYARNIANAFAIPNEERLNGGIFKVVSKLTTVVLRAWAIKQAGIEPGSEVSLKDGQSPREVIKIHRDFNLKVEGITRPVSPRTLA